MIYIILIVLIIIVIIYLCCNLLQYDHFTDSDTTSDAINNIVSMINDDTVNFNNLTVNGKLTAKELINDMSNRFDTFETKLMKIIYPIGSLFLTKTSYNLSNKQSLINTPLYYGTWNMVDTGSSYAFLRPVTKSNEQIYMHNWDFPKNNITTGLQSYPVIVYRKISL